MKWKINIFGNSSSKHIVDHTLVGSECLCGISIILSTLHRLIYCQALQSAPIENCSFKFAEIKFNIAM